MKATPQPLSRIPAKFKKLATLDVRAAAEAIFADMPGKVDDCAFMAALRGSKLNGLELLDQVLTFPGYVPRVTALDSLAMGPDLFEEKPLAEWMGFWAAELARQPFDEFNKSVQRILTERAADLPPEAWAPLIVWFGESHPKAVEYLARHEGKMPESAAVAEAMAAVADTQPQTSTQKEPTP